MFTGIIEAEAEVVALRHSGTNVTYTLRAGLAPELRVDQSLAHDGVCLTVEQIDLPQQTYEVTAIAETLARTALHQWAVGTRVNLERCLPVGGRLDGHFVQGHVDATGTVQTITPQDGSWEITIQFPPQYRKLLVAKGSIALQGISLTIARLTADTFTVAIIPYTWAHTNLSALTPRQAVNLEFDILGKYILNHVEPGGLR